MLLKKYTHFLTNIWIIELKSIIYLFIYFFYNIVNTAQEFIPPWNMNSSIYNNTRQRKFLNRRSNNRDFYIYIYIYIKEKSLSF